MRSEIIQKFSSILRQRNNLDRQLSRITGSCLDSLATAEWVASEIFLLAFTDHIATWPDSRLQIKTRWIRGYGDVVQMITEAHEGSWLVLSDNLDDDRPTSLNSSEYWEFAALYLIPANDLESSNWSAHRIFPPHENSESLLSAEQISALTRLSSSYYPALERTI